MVTRALPVQESITWSNGQLNAFRMNVVPKRPTAGNSRTHFRLVLGAYADSVGCVQGALEGGCEVICFEPVFTSGDRKCRDIPCPSSLESQITAASAMCNNAGVRFILKFPRITRNNYLENVLPVLAKGEEHGYLRIFSGKFRNCPRAHAGRYRNSTLRFCGAEYF